MIDNFSQAAEKYSLYFTPGADLQKYTETCAAAGLLP